MEIEDTLIAIFFSDLDDPANKLRGHYTHCEVCPFFLTGISAGLIPFAEFNQSPRLVYQAGMGKQAIGTPSLPLAGWMRPTDHVLGKNHLYIFFNIILLTGIFFSENPEHPVVGTILQRLPNLPFHSMPCGENCIVLVGNFAWNVEDSLVISRSFVERGGMCSYSDRTYNQTAR